MKKVLYTYHFKDGYKYITNYIDRNKLIALIKEHGKYMYRTIYGVFGAYGMYM